MATTTPNDVLKNLLDYEDKQTANFRKWFLKQFEKTNASNGCCLEDFVDYFLNSLRQNTEKHLKVNTTGTNTPICETPVRTLGPNGAPPPCEEIATTPSRLMLDLQHTSTPNKSTHSRTLDSSHNATDEPNEILQISMGDGDFESFLFTSRLSSSADRSGNSQRHDTSTPKKRNNSCTNSKRIPPATPTSSVSLGDFINFGKSSSRSHKKKNNSGNEKPKKRVQPISVCKKIEKSGGGNTSSVFAGESSFSNENNILQISHTEVDDKQQCAILAARKTLKTNASEITKELAESPRKASTPTRQIVAVASVVAMEESPLQLENIANNKILKRLAEIYTTLIDLSLVTNYLNELSYLLNLLSAPTTAPVVPDDLTKDLEIMTLRTEDECSKSLSCLMDINYAICFALLCLNQQQQLIALLDSKTLKVIINNSRFCYLNEDVRTFLIDVHRRKQLILAENNMHESSFCFIDTKSFTNVYFQQDQHSRQNFSSSQEFGNFRVQRDLFYKCLKLWETNHLNPNWKFSVEISPIIREIFQYSQLFVNMAHFANLFVSQLLLSASNASSPEEIGVDVDMQKLNRLTQRLIAPSQFSVDYQFPRAQAFFRDFILLARSLAFAEQLKMALYSELLSMNDSSFDHINITSADNEPNNHDKSFVADYTIDQVAVRPEILNSMLILAKFLGFTISLPYSCNSSNVNIIPPAVEKKQISLRTLIQPNFDLYCVVESGIEEGKLLVTIPWMVQYISMLDSITLQLEVHSKLLKLLFALHWYLARDGNKILPPTSKFIITSCLSWLFDSKQIITEQYYNFRVLQTTNPMEMETTVDQIKRKLERCRVETEAQEKFGTLNPVLEALLPVACPFLGEFRVSIMPAKYASTKYASRSGRYRHITTRIADYSPTLTDDSILEKSPSNKPKDTQNCLIQAFFHSQNASTRQLITFCSERCFKSVVRDAQLNILLPCKSKADAEVNKIDSNSSQAVYAELNRIYTEAHKEAVEKWNTMVPKMLEKRIQRTLDSLLPEETSVILKKVYFMVIKQNAQQKISQWCYGNIIKDNYFCVDLKNMASKICMAEKSKQTSDLKIVCISPSPSELMSSLQYWLHVTSLRTELLGDSEPIVQMFKSLKESLENAFPTVFYRLIALYTIKLLQNIIRYKCVHLTDELMDVSGEVLQKVDNDLNLTGYCEDENKHFIYDSLITMTFFQSLAASQSECYTRFGDLVISLIKKGIISMSYANELFVALLKNDWPPLQLNEISNLLRYVAQETAGLSAAGSYDADCDQQEDDDEKSNLFMDMLADLSRDVELF